MKKLFLLLGIAAALWPRPALAQLPSYPNIKVTTINYSTVYSDAMPGATTAAQVQYAVNSYFGPTLIIITGQQSGTAGDFSGISLPSANYTIMDLRGGIVTYGVKSPGSGTPIAEFSIGQSGSTLVPLSYTVANLPAAPLTNTLAIVTDGNSSSDCTVGLGANRVLCAFNGTVWAALGGGGGGSGTVNAGTQYQAAYYATTGTAVSGASSLTTSANGGWLISGGTGNAIAFDVIGSTNAGNPNIFCADLPGSPAATCDAASIDHLGTISGVKGQFGVGSKGTVAASIYTVNGATSGSATISASATGGTLNLGSTNATVTSAGALTVASCSGCGGGSVSLDNVTGAASSNTATETSAGNYKVFAGVETSALTYPYIFTNANSSGNTTSGALLVATTGTSNAATPLTLWESTQTGDGIVFYTGGSLTGNTLSGATKRFNVASTGTATASSFNANGSGAPTNGIYNPTAGVLGLSANTTKVFDIATTLTQVTSGVLQAAQNRVRLTADWTCGTGGTITSCSNAIVGTSGSGALTITLPSSAQDWHWQCEGVVGQATATVANTWSFQTGTNAPTNMEATYQMGDSATTYGGGATTGISATTATAIGGNWTLGGTATKMPFRVQGWIEGASSSGTTISLLLTSGNNADLITIYRGTYCSVSAF